MGNNLVEGALCAWPFISFTVSAAQVDMRSWISQLSTDWLCIWRSGLSHVSSASLQRLRRQIWISLTYTERNKGETTLSSSFAPQLTPKYCIKNGLMERFDGWNTLGTHLLEIGIKKKGKRRKFLENRGKSMNWKARGSMERKGNESEQTANDDSGNWYVLVLKPLMIC